MVLLVHSTSLVHKFYLSLQAVFFQNTAVKQTNQTLKKYLKFVFTQSSCSCGNLCCRLRHQFLCIFQTVTHSCVTSNSTNSFRLRGILFLSFTQFSSKFQFSNV